MAFDGPHLLNSLLPLPPHRNHSIFQSALLPIPTIFPLLVNLKFMVLQPIFCFCTFFSCAQAYEPSEVCYSTLDITRISADSFDNSSGYIRISLFAKEFRSSSSLISLFVSAFAFSA